MISLVVCLGLTSVIAAVARLLGASKKISIVFALLPMIALLMRLAATEGLELGPHGGIVPPSLTIVFGLFFAFIAALVVASVAKKKRPNQSPQRNAGSRPSSGDSPATETPSSLGPRG